MSFENKWGLGGGERKRCIPGLCWQFQSVWGQFCIVSLFAILYLLYVLSLCCYGVCQFPHCIWGCTGAYKCKRSWPFMNSGINGENIVAKVWSCNWWTSAWRDWENKVICRNYLYIFYLCCQHCLPHNGPVIIHHFEAGIAHNVVVAFSIIPRWVRKTQVSITPSWNRY